MIETAKWSRRLIKVAVATALVRTRAETAVSGFLRKATPLVAGYHRVVESFEREADRANPAMLVSRSMLERHLDRIGRRYRFASLDEVGSHIGQPVPSGRPLAAVTFDDGYRDVYENAFPLLLRKGIPAAVFVVTDLIGTDRLQRHDELYALLVRARATWSAPASTFAERVHTVRPSLAPADAQRLFLVSGGDAGLLTLALLRTLSRPETEALIGRLVGDVGPVARTDRGLLPLTWSMVEEMHRAGMTIGSHTRTHARLGAETPARLLPETAESRRQIETHLGSPVRHLAYPDGSFNRAAVEAVDRAGYAYAYTTCVHCDVRYPKLTIPRRLLWERSSVDAAGRFVPAILDCQMYGLLTGPRACKAESHA